jgi:hypothetical protein
MADQSSGSSPYSPARFVVSIERWTGLEPITHRRVGQRWAKTAYRRATGKSDGFWDAVQAGEASANSADQNAGSGPTDQNTDESTADENARNSRDAEPAGAQFDFEDSTLMADHFPRLSALDLT